MAKVSRALVNFKGVERTVKRPPLKIRNGDLKILFENLRGLGIEPSIGLNPKTVEVYKDTRKAMLAVIDHINKFLDNGGFGEVKIEVSPARVKVETRPGLSTELLAQLVVLLGKGEKARDGVNKFLQRLWKLKESKSKVAKPKCT